MKNSDNIYDYLIVGQGIGGTMLSYQAFKRKKSFKLIDNSFNRSASMISSGVINPVTGRRIVKSWMIEELMEKAEKDYKDISSLIGENIIKFSEITRLLKDAEEENIWTAKAQNEAVSYLSDISASDIYNEYFTNFRSQGIISPALVIGMESLLLGWRDFLIYKKSYIESELKHQDISIDSEGVRYSDMIFKKLIFADGQNGLSSYYFNDLKYEVAKGEVLYIKSDSYHNNEMVKAGINIIPAKDDSYWVGSNYEWDPTDNEPSSKTKAFILNKLNKSVRFEYDIIDHKAAIRACTKDRRPYIGIHPEYPQLVIFNGLGTKGISLAPYFADHLFDHLEHNAPLMPEIDIQRLFS